MNTYKLLLADDHKIVRDGIIALLEDDEKYHIVGEAENGREALEFINKTMVDVLIIDLNMPELNGIETIKKLRENYTDLKILALSMVNQHDAIKNTVEAGVNGYVLKSSSSEEIIQALETITQGGHYFCEETTKTIMDGLSGIQKRKQIAVDELTPREKDVLKLICKEMTNTEISKQLNISIRTVDSHRRNLLQKIGAKNTVGLVKFAIKSGLVNEE